MTLKQLQDKVEREKCCKCSKPAKYNVRSAMFDKNYCGVHVKQWEKNILCFIEKL